MNILFNLRETLKLLPVSDLKSLRYKIRRYTLTGFLLFCCILFTECGQDTPEKIFNIAVLNSNFLVGFAGSGMERQLESPSVKLNEGSNEPVTMKRSDVVNSKIEFAETNLKEIKGLKETDDTKEMLDASQALYEFIIPVYKTEYMQLAGLYDSVAAKDRIESMSALIHDKYSSRYEELYNKLIGSGKKYAEKHSIKVNWGMN